MILTGPEIQNEIACGEIVIEPFSIDQVNPNSYNYRLGNILKEHTAGENGQGTFCTIQVPEDGYVLKPQQMYLAHTAEVIGSSRYAMSLIGRSSLGRLGLFLQVSADLGHTTSKHQWTLELVACQPIKLYPNMVIGQISFWENSGKIAPYNGTYGHLNNAQESRLFL